VHIDNKICIPIFHRDALEIIFCIQGSSINGSKQTVGPETAAGGQAFNPARKIEAEGANPNP
jgi:hypothetical protein